MKKRQQFAAAGQLSSSSSKIQQKENNAQIKSATVTFGMHEKCSFWTTMIDWIRKKTKRFWPSIFSSFEKRVKNICSNRHIEHAIKPQSANAKLKWLFVWRISFDKSILWQQHKRRQTSESINNSHFIL